MTSTRNPMQDFILTPQQQSLLFAALNSNKPNASPSNNVVKLSSPSSFTESPVQMTNSIQESPFLDYDYDFGGDSSFDFSYDHGNEMKMIGDLPGDEAESSKSDSPDNDSPDKRGHPDDEDDDESGAKRRESEEKVAKKPGRKPLTSEPSSKRKAQNRAAQRAFRERKEKHLKDLETKVQELEKASESANNENTALRAQVEKMTVELNEYKKQLSLVTNSRAAPPPNRAFGFPLTNNINDVNFQFEFPKFGTLPGPSPAMNGPKRISGASPLERNSSGQISPLEKPRDNFSPGNSSTYSQIGLDLQTKEDIANFAASLFSPSTTSKSVPSPSRNSLDSHFSVGGATATSSPSASSNSNVGPSSSCGTSPEPYTQSPMGFKPVDTLTTIGEEQTSLATTGQDFGHFSNIDVNDFTWLASQNNFQFDPQLFGDYREPQDNILSSGGMDDTFFNDAFDVDFTTPFNAMLSTPRKESLALKNNLATQKKNDLIAQIDEAKNEDKEIQGPDGQLLTCNSIWEKLQGCQRVQSGDFDLDGLCSDLQKKAKCSGSGAVVNEADFKNVMKKYLGRDMGDCAGDKLGTN